MACLPNYGGGRQTDCLGHEHAGSGVQSDGIIRKYNTLMSLRFREGGGAENYILLNGKMGRIFVNSSNKRQRLPKLVLSQK